MYGFFDYSDVDLWEGINDPTPESIERERAEAARLAPHEGNPVVLECCGKSVTLNHLRDGDTYLFCHREIPWLEAECNRLNIQFAFDRYAGYTLRVGPDWTFPEPEQPAVEQRVEQPAVEQRVEQPAVEQRVEQRVEQPAVEQQVEQRVEVEPEPLDFGGLFGGVKVSRRKKK